MKTLRSNFLRFFMCFTLIFTMFIPTLSVSAAGVETWNQMQGPVERMRVTNNNLTPIKTMGRSAFLQIEWNATPCKVGHCSCSDREPGHYPPTKVNIQIRNANTGAVLAQYTKNEGGANDLMHVYVTKGQKIQIFFDVSSQYNAPGPYRKAHISYNYRFLN